LMFHQDCFKNFQLFFTNDLLLVHFVQDYRMRAVFWNAVKAAYAYVLVCKLSEYTSKQNRLRKNYLGQQAKSTSSWRSSFTQNGTCDCFGKELQ
jgi:hypothetical protein